MHQRRSAEDHEGLYGFVSSGSKQSFGICRPPRRPSRSVRIILIPLALLASTIPRLRLYSFMVESAFVGIITSIKARQWLFCLRLSSRLFLERVWGTQGLPCIPPRVALDKTPSTSSGRKFRMERPPSSSIHLYQVWYGRGPRRVQPHLILLRKTSAFGWNNTREN